MDRRHFISLCGAGVISLWAPAAFAEAPASDPRAIVEEIYKISAGAKGDYTGPSAFNDLRVRKRYFSKPLGNAVRKMERKSAKTNEPILDFDPITDSQEPSVRNLKIDVQTRTDQQTTIEASFTSFEDGKRRSVLYDFVKLGKDWKLENIHGGQGDEKWSLREIAK
jgi:hypothetical protein